ncbi:MAG: ATP-binding protein [Gammaproteobacteria bacterium]|nr:ATP-binding protein [Gammaproteobacteria bacterium]
MIVPAGNPVRKFNPGTLQSDEEIKRQFVVRREEFVTVLDVLRGNVDAPSCQHLMVVAPRGRGKTMLLARVAAELRTDAELSTRLLPIRFMEENFEVFNLGDFWAETLFQFAREIAGSEPELADELRRSRTDFLGRNPRDLAGQAYAAILDAADRLGRRLVFMVENMQDLWGDVDDDFGWQLRGVLQTEPRIMLVGTATARFAGLEHVDQPFFEMFRFLELKPLDTDGCRRLWNVICGDDVTDRSMRPLEILTGGSPRLLVMVAEFARHQSLKQLMEELVTVIDEYTEYFRGHLEVLAKGERRVYVAVVDLWQPSTTGEIAERARMDVRATSTLLGRLLAKGLVGFEGTGKRRRYTATERLYGIYYKLRRERDEAAVVENLIRFMTAFYSEDELAGMWEVLAREAVESPPIQEGLLRAFDATLAEHSRGPLPGGRKLMTSLATGRFREAIEVADHLLAGAAAGLPALTMLLAKAMAYAELGDVEELFGAYEKIEEHLGDIGSAKAGAMVAKVMLSNGSTLQSENRLREAAAVYDRMLGMFSANRGDLRVASSLLSALDLKAVALLELGDSDVAVRVADDAQRMFGTGRTPEERWRLARMLATKRAAFARLDDDTAVIGVCEQVVAQYGENNESILKAEVARALLHAGFAHQRLGSAEDALASWRRVVDRYRESEEPDLRSVVAPALLAQASVHAQGNTYPLAEELCEDLLRRFGEADSVGLRASAAWALVVKGGILLETGREAEAIRVADELERTFGELDDGLELTFAWRASYLRATGFLRLRRFKEAMEAARTAYTTLSPTPRAIQAMTELVASLVSGGASPEDLLELILEDEERAEVIGPLRVALEQECGRDVRAPAEVLEVAADIRKEWADRAARGAFG